MKNWKQLIGVAGALVMVLGSGCSATTGGDGDATDGTGDGTAAVDNGVAPGNDAVAGTDAAADTGVVAGGFKYGIIYDKYAEPDCTKTTSPGSDIDAIGLYRGGQLIGVVKVGTANYKDEKTSCKDNAHSTTSDCEGPSDVLDTKTGYVGLNGGSIEFQIGGCSVSTTDVTVCDGKGPAVTIQAGDEFDVYEVGQAYKTKGWIKETCLCIDEDYEVWVRLDKGVDAGSVLVGNGKGLTSGMKVPAK